MSDNKNLNEKEIENRKLSAAAGGGLLGFSFAGPLGALIGAVSSIVAASIYFDKDGSGDQK